MITAFVNMFLNGPIPACVLGDGLDTACNFFVTSCYSEILAMVFRSVIDYLALSMKMATFFYVVTVILGVYN